MDSIQTFMHGYEKEWQSFCTNNKLSTKQQELFAHFGLLLLEWNQKHNLTAITNVVQIINDHFQDSLSIARTIDIASLKGCCDIGSGGGFPGIPLKIIFPNVPMVLIEVNTKKIMFLNYVIQQLGLENILVCPLDWRTFIRTTNYAIDLFCARASLRPDELVRMYTEEKSPYKRARLVYWASRHWHVSETEQRFFDQEVEYTIGDKVRKLVFFRKK